MVDDTTTDAAEARAPGHDEVPTLEQATRWLNRFSNQDEVASTTPRKIAFELAGIHSLLLSLATAEAASGAGEREEWQEKADEIAYACQAVRHSSVSAADRDGILQDAAAHLRLVASLPPTTDPAMVTVPREWPDKMLRYISERWSSRNSDPDAPWEDIREIWSLALAAAPTIPATGEAK